MNKEYSEDERYEQKRLFESRLRVHSDKVSEFYELGDYREEMTSIKGLWATRVVKHPTNRKSKWVQLFIGDDGNFYPKFTIDAAHLQNLIDCAQETLNQLKKGGFKG